MSLVICTVKASAFIIRPLDSICFYMYIQKLSRVMRKPTFYICENKDQGLCFRYIFSTIPLLSKSKFQASSHLLWFYSLFVSHQVGNQNVGFLMTRLNSLKLSSLVRVLPAVARFASRRACQLLVKWALNTGKLPPGGLPRNSVLR